MSDVGRFAELVAKGQARDGAIALPTSLARAAARVLDAAGAVISVFSGPSARVVVGVSDENAAAAGSVEFTSGAGPCLRAHHTGRSVFATTRVMRESWPLLSQELFARTPFRRVVAVPLRSHGTGVGVLELFLGSFGGIDRVRWPDVVQVADAVTAALTRGADTSLDAASEPLWLSRTAASQRELWAAVGMASAELVLPPPDALAVLRAMALSRGQDVNDLAADLTSSRLPLAAVQQ